jgi:triacylglycerol lipase
VARPLDRARAVRYGAFVDAAYDRVALPGGYRIVERLRLRGEPFGFVAASTSAGGESVVVLPSTGTSLRWYDDVDVAFVPFAGGGRIGAGYQEHYRALAGFDALVTPYVLVGHGFGGALATVHVMEAALRGAVPPAEVYTFGSPRVGDAAFVAAYDALDTATWRVANHRDLTQRIPAADYGYEHVATHVAVDSMGRASLDHHGTHAMNVYLHLLDPAVPLDATHAPDRGTSII